MTTNNDGELQTGPSAVMCCQLLGVVFASQVAVAIVDFVDHEICQDVRGVRVRRAAQPSAVRHIRARTHAHAHARTHTRTHTRVHTSPCVKGEHGRLTRQNR